MRRAVVGLGVLLACANARAQQVAPDDAPAPIQPTQPQAPVEQQQQQPNYVAPQQDYVAPQQNYVAPQNNYYVAPAQPYVPSPDMIAEAERLDRTGRGMRAGGAVMIAVGAAVAVAGIVCGVLGVGFGGGYDSIASISLDLVGAGLIGGGVPLLVAGNARIRRAHVLRYGQLGISFAPTALRITF